ncbi:DUF58 domain-containing protein [Bartonella sp. F02]|uniref:DUF58 domain-containing protein n=1 Tax=Bartonella sp. F02 TaxID=2967262 RepID=UPI0022A97FED|nr:DUF58 domain-containing protein [Bartonella sp. F02]MCZ2328722.1 DUF58 domain-containing protein [Bartonella sp. F02]
MAIGKKVNQKQPLSLATLLPQNIADMPHLLLQARFIANTFITGKHAQHKHGHGENFWQFRPYTQGESCSRIDWRRSARDENIYLREHEWEITQTIWIWPDQSVSMHYCSRFSKISKGNYAIILTLALTTILAHNGERIAIPQLMAPSAASNITERVALALTNDQNKNPFPDFSAIPRFSHVIIISDFLDHSEKIIQHLTTLIAKQINVHLIEIADPAEENFPYTGRTEFFDPETKKKLVLGKAENLRESYCKLYQTRRQDLKDFCSRQGWTYHVSTTDRSLTETILQLKNKLDISTHHTRRFS